MQGCLVIILIIVVWKIGGCAVDQFTEWRDEKAKQVEQEKAREETEERIAEENRKKAEAEAEARHRQEVKDEKIRSFALKDAPKVWAVCQSLQSEIDVQNGKIEELRKTLVAFGKEPEQDVDFQRICALRDDMTRSRKALRTKLEDAYIASRKYEASPSRKDYQELHKKALEDGILEADAAAAKFKEMRLNK